MQSTPDCNEPANFVLILSVLGLLERPVYTTASLAVRPRFRAIRPADAVLAVWLLVAFAGAGPLRAQEPPPAVPSAEAPAAPEAVQVNPIARDDEIRQRIDDILRSTEWFSAPVVRVSDGVVFLSGSTETAEFKKWAGDLARSTQDVVAVVNRIEVIEPSILDFGPALDELRRMSESGVRAVPIIAFGIFILLIAWIFAQLAASVARSRLKARQINPLLRDVISRAVWLAIFLVGLYIVFQVAGLTTVALTVMGGTGLLGIVLGIAFRDITENLLASIFLSVQNPFQNGDLIEIEGVTGMVQQLTIRATVLMTLDGNHVQIPNATVYKSKIINFSSNPNRREVFAVGVGYDDSIAEAQEVALAVLTEHPGVLNAPEPWVLVDELGSATVNLKIYFWIDGARYSHIKVRSSVIRLVKRAFQTAGISMPDEAREMIFPNGVPVRMLGEEAPAPAPARAAPAPAEAPVDEPAAVSTEGEGGLSSEALEIQQQARQSRTPEEGRNLLKSAEE